MKLLNLDELKKQSIFMEKSNNSGFNQNYIKQFEANLKSLFAENVNEIYLKKKWRSKYIQKGYLTIQCKLKKDAIYIQQIKSPADPLINYKYVIKRDELIKNNMIIHDEDKTPFFKYLVKIIDWAEAEKLDVAFK